MKIDEMCRYYDFMRMRCTLRNNGSDKCFFGAKASECPYLKSLATERLNGKKQALQEKMPVKELTYQEKADKRRKLR